jgi:hypothetical protein
MPAQRFVDVDGIRYRVFKDDRGRDRRIKVGPAPASAGDEKKTGSDEPAESSSAAEERDEAEEPGKPPGSSVVLWLAGAAVLGCALAVAAVWWAAGDAPDEDLDGTTDEDLDGTTDLVDEDGTTASSAGEPQLLAVV